ncbi:nucleotide disphospho-sugar-binding domain-containing protein [Amycolatopsis sp. NPDC051903]|uniref:nucleotide disphospho-sugar-binding domain-containing protein n=1 Tax=Amycolatopsis sp. NPDC051903 TaxID=3363936 RepID=UPI00378EEA0B
MRVLLAAPSSPARLRNLVPLTWALRTAGHDVKIAGQPSFVEEILSTGTVAVDLEDRDDASLAESAALTEFAKLWRPQVVVSAGQAPAGTAAARAVDAVAVRLLGALDEPDASDADTTYDTVPASLRAGGGGARPVRHVPYFGPVEVPMWLRRKARRARVLLSLSDAELFGPVFDAVASVDAEVLCAAGSADFPAGTTVPANVRLVDSAPPAALLPTCAAVIHDGDAELALAAATHGLPQLSLIASTLIGRVEAAGAGLVDAAPAAGLIRDLITGGALRAGAHALRDEIAALPAPREVAAELAR